MDDNEKTMRGIISRLKRVEGQIRGLQRMIEDEQDCSAVVTQLSAARSALDKVGFMILSHRVEECLRRKIEEGQSADSALEDAMKLFLKLS